MNLNAKLSALLAGLSLVSMTPTATADGAVPPKKGVGITATAKPGITIQEQNLISAYKPFLAELEGTRYNVYDDRGVPAIGWGYNFDTKSKTSYKFVKVQAQNEGIVSLNAKDMETLASDKLTLAQKKAKFPQYTLSEVSMTAAQLKAARKPAGMDAAFQGDIYVMSAAKVAELNNTRLRQFIQEVTSPSIVGEQKFYSWPLGVQMAYLDMYYPLRGGIVNTKFHQYVVSGKFDSAATEAWASDKEKSTPGKKKRRHETRSVWLKKRGVLPGQVEAICAQYVKDLPGEVRLHRAMKTFLTDEAKQNKGIQDAVAKQNSSHGG